MTDAAADSLLNSMMTSLEPVVLYGQPLLPGHEPLQELPLPEDDLDLVLHPAADVDRPVVRLRATHLLREERRSPPRAAAGDGDEQPENDGAYEPRTLLSSALIAGTTSCRSPMTA